MPEIVPEPIVDLAHLAHVELLTPDLEASAGFFRDILGLQETERRGASVYLRGYEEVYHHSLQLTAAPKAGLGHVAWRARSPQALARRVAALEAAGRGRGWIDPGPGHGRAFRFETPEGHPMELFWEVDYAATPPGMDTALRNRPQRRPRVGVPARRLDHLNLMAADTAAARDFLIDTLGFRERERVEIDDGGPVIATWLSVTNLTHDIALLHEPTPARGRFHHLCFHYHCLQHLYDVAEVAREAGITIEYGPGRHGIGGGTFLYMIEPGGHRIEALGDTGYLIFDPAWRPVVWKASEVGTAVAWSGGAPPESFWLPAGAPAAAAQPSAA